MKINKSTVYIKAYTMKKPIVFFMIIFTELLLVSCAPDSENVHTSLTTQQTDTPQRPAEHFYNPDHHKYQIGVEEVDALCSINENTSSNDIRAACLNRDFKQVIKEDQYGYQTVVQDDEDVDQNGISNEDKLVSTVLYKDATGFYDFLDMSEMDASIYHENSLSIGQYITVEGFTIENNAGNLIMTSSNNEKVRIEKDKVIFYLNTN